MQNQNTLEVAESLQKLCWDVIPLLGKNPNKKDWPSIPSKSLLEIKEELENWNSENIGVRLGRHSTLRPGIFLACIDGDIDTDDPAEIQKYKDAWGLLGTFWGDGVVAVGTGSNPLARHVYVGTTQEYDAPIVLKQSKSEQGTTLWAITLYANSKRQMVLPPSIHPETKRRYHWISPPKSDQKLFVVDKEFFEGLGIDPFQPTEKQIAKDLPDFENAKVDLAIIFKLPLHIQKELVQNEGLADRSAGLLLVASELYKRGFTDAEVLYTLTDPQYHISQVAQKRRGDNRRSQAEWIWKYTCQKAREASATNSFTPVEGEETRDSEAVEGQSKEGQESAIVLTPEQQNCLKGLRRDKNGKLLTTIDNTVKLLENVCGQKDWAAQDIFRRESVYRIETPWGGQNGSPIRDADDVKISYYLSKEFNFNPSFELVVRAIEFVCAENSFHSGQEFLESLQWDGKKRIDHWLKTYLGAISPGATCLSEISRKVMLAIIARQMEPGIKFDYVLLLKGAQGIGKSSAVDILNGHPAMGRIDPDRPADSVLCMVGQRVVELAECWTLAKRESESVKAFFSAPSDKIRAPYERRPDLYPRQSIFIGTTNRDDFLQDSTGERRYWVVEVTQCDFDGLTRDRDQLFAEALSEWKTRRENLWLSDESKATMEQFHQEFKQTDTIEEMLSEELDNEESEIAIAIKNDALTLKMVSERLVGVNGVTDMRLERRIGEALRKQGFVKKVRKLNGRFGKFWVKKQFP